MNRCTGTLSCLAMILVSCLGCGISPIPPLEDKVESETWISLPPNQWPQMVLTNYAEFEGHTELDAASGFLIRTPEDEVIAATAKHLVGYNGGVEPTLPVTKLNERLRMWRMFPRTKPDDFVEITGLAAGGLDQEGLDWLLLTIEPTDPLPAYPLRARKQPVEIGETVYLIGCPYSEPDCQQNVYTGVVTGRDYDDRFRYDLKPAVDLRGFSGAPIIDKNGHLVGVMTVWFDPKMSGDQYLEGGGEDLTFVYQAL